MITIANVMRQNFVIILATPKGNKSFTVPYSGTVTIPDALQDAAIAQLSHYGMVSFEAALTGSEVVGLAYAQDAEIDEDDIGRLRWRSREIERAKLSEETL
jgi:hypothetical protein